jgi:hypothetical protein
MLVLLPAAMAAGVTLSAADRVPTYDVEPSCRAAASAAASPGYAAICRNEEANARAELELRWPQFKSLDKAHCLPMSTLGGKPTYTELLTCLELERDARELRNRTATGTIGSGHD